MMIDDEQKEFFDQLKDAVPIDKLLNDLEINFRHQLVDILTEQNKYCLSKEQSIFIDSCVKEELRIARAKYE